MQHVATCRTQDCGNEGVALNAGGGDLPIHIIMCGECGTQITDVEPPLPAPDEEG